MSIKDEKYKARIEEIMQSTDLSENRKRVEAGRAAREAVTRLKGENKTNAEIAELLGIAESSVRTIIGPPKRHTRKDIGEILQAYDLSMDEAFEIHGPWGWRGLEGFETPAYIFQKGTGEKVLVGKVIAKIEGGLKFEIQLDEDYKDIKDASFEAPMRFAVKRKEST